MYTSLDVVAPVLGIRALHLYARLSVVLDESCIRLSLPHLGRLIITCGY